MGGKRVKVSLVLEGGGMRGTYSTGVLDFLLDTEFSFDSCYGVSAGAGHACSFLSKQRGRAFRVVSQYTHLSDYAGVRSFLSTGNFFNVDFIYRKIPDRLEPFDYETFEKNPTKFFSVATNVKTGHADYLEISDLKKDMGKVVASSSLPFLSKMIEVDNQLYLDGGIGDSIPVQKALAESDKAVVVLTRSALYRKNPFRNALFLKLKYGKYPEFCRAMLERHIHYNETLDFLTRAENEGKVFLFRPKLEPDIGRLERNREKLRALYERGFEEALARKKEFENFLRG